MVHIPIIMGNSIPITPPEEVKGPNLRPTKQASETISEQLGDVKSARFQEQGDCYDIEVSV